MPGSGVGSRTAVISTSGGHPSPDYPLAASVSARTLVANATAAAQDAAGEKNHEFERVAVSFCRRHRHQCGWDSLRQVVSIPSDQQWQDRFDWLGWR